MEYKTLFDKNVNGGTVPSGQWGPLNEKKNVLVGDRVLSRRGIHGVVVEIELVNDCDGVLCIGCVIYWYSHAARMSDRVGNIVISECDLIMVEP